MNKTNEYRNIGVQFAIEKIIPLLKPDTKYFIAVSGSVGYGFADEKSDIELEVYVEDIASYPEITQLLEKENSYMGAEMSSGIPSWEINKIITEEFLITLNENPNTYFEIKNSFGLIDPYSIFQNMQDRLGFYSDEDKLKIIRGLYLQMIELGSHISQKAALRRLSVEASIGFYTAIEALLRLIHILNDEFFPHTKWLTSSLNKLPNKFGVDEFILKVTNEKDIQINTNLFRDFTEDFARNNLMNTFLSSEETYNPWCMIKSPEIYHFFSTLAKY